MSLGPSEEVIKAPREPFEDPTMFELVQHHERAIIATSPGGDVILTQVIGRCLVEAWENRSIGLLFLEEHDWTKDFGDATVYALRSFAISWAEKQEWWD